MQGQPWAEQGTKRPSIAWAPAQHDAAGIFVSGFQSHWKSWQSSPEFLLVPVTKANPGLKRSNAIISERGNGLVRLFICGLAQRLSGQDPKIWQMCRIMRSDYNLGCWETMNRLNLLSSVISPSRTGPVTRARCSSAASRPLSCDSCQRPRAHLHWHSCKYTRIFKAAHKELLYVCVLHISTLLAPISGRAFSPHALNTTFILYEIMVLVELTTLQVLKGALYR